MCFVLFFEQHQCQINVRNLCIICAFLCLYRPLLTDKLYVDENFKYCKTFQYDALHAYLFMVVINKYILDNDIIFHLS